MYKKYKPEFQSVEKALVCQKIPLHSVSPFFWVKILALNINKQTHNLVASVVPGIHSDFSPKNFIALLSKTETFFRTNDY